MKVVLGAVCCSCVARLLCPSIDGLLSAVRSTSPHNRPVAPIRKRLLPVSFKPHRPYISPVSSIHTRCLLQHGRRHPPRKRCLYLSPCRSPHHPMPHALANPLRHLPLRRPRHSLHHPQKRKHRKRPHYPTQILGSYALQIPRPAPQIP